MYFVQWFKLKQNSWLHVYVTAKQDETLIEQYRAVPLDRSAIMERWWLVGFLSAWQISITSCRSWRMSCNSRAPRLTSLSKKRNRGSLILSAVLFRAPTACKSLKLRWHRKISQYYMHTGCMFILRLCINLVIIKVSITDSTDGEIYPSPPELKINKSKFIIKIEQKITSNRNALSLIKPIVFVIMCNEFNAKCWINCRICRTCLHVTVWSEGSNLYFHFVEWLNMVPLLLSS